MQIFPGPKKDQMSHMAAKFNRSSNHKLWGDWRLKSKGNKAIVYPTKLDDP